MTYNKQMQRTVEALYVRAMGARPLIWNVWRLSGESK